MQAERQINRESVTCVTVFKRTLLLFKSSGDARGGNLSFLLTFEASSWGAAGKPPLFLPGILLFAFEKNDFLMRERDFNPSLIKRFFDQFRYSKAHIEPVFAFDKWARGEID